MLLLLTAARLRSKMGCAASVPSPASSWQQQVAAKRKASARDLLSLLPLPPDSFFLQKLALVMRGADDSDTLAWLLEKALADGSRFSSSGGGSRLEYKLAKRLLRSVAEVTTSGKGRSMHASLNAAESEILERPGVFEGYVDVAVLRANMEAYQELARRVQAANADVIVGMQRGGAFLVDVLEAIDPSLSSRLCRPRKVYPKQEMWRAMHKLVTDVIGAGRRTFCFVEVYMSGYSARALVEQVFIPVLQDYASQLDVFCQLQFSSIWLRETWGLESYASMRLYEVQDEWAPPGLGSVKDKIAGDESSVPFIVGDDVNSFMDYSPSSRSSISVYRADGSIAAVLSPRRGKNTRDLATRLLAGRASDPRLHRELQEADVHQLQSSVQDDVPASFTPPPSADWPADATLKELLEALLARGHVRAAEAILTWVGRYSWRACGHTTG